MRMDIDATMKRTLMGAAILLMVCASAALVVYISGEDAKTRGVKEHCRNRYGTYPDSAYIPNPDYQKELADYEKRKWKYGHMDAPEKRIPKDGARKVLDSGGARYQYNRCVSKELLKQ